MSTVTASGSPGMARMIRQSFHAMTPVERRRVLGMYGSILLLHALGFFVFIVLVVPEHYKGLAIGVSVLAYTLGLRHAFDADHISAIDNTTRKAMNQRNEFVNRTAANEPQGTVPPRPFAFGFFSSLGHSTIVVAIGVGIIIAERTLLAYGWAFFNPVRKVFHNLASFPMCIDFLSGGRLLVVDSPYPASSSSSPRREPPARWPTTSPSPTAWPSPRTAPR